MARATISEVPPGANGATRRIGLLGHWAAAPSETKKASAAKTLLMMRISLSELVAPQSPVGGDHGAGDVARAGRPQERDQRRQLLRFAVATHVDLVLRLPL